MKVIEITTEFIKLGQFLKLVGIIDSGAYAKDYLSLNSVYVNDEIESRRGRKIYPDYIIKVENGEYLVKKR